MWKCHKCGKPVYFAERKQSLGYDWHPECLRCEECGKRLNPGQHAEHKGVPYCHVPCYGALFGPQLFGHGTRVESHKSFGVKGAHRSSGNNGSNLPRDHLESKLKVYNQFYDSKSLEIRSREVNDRLILEGALRVYWGVQAVIHLKEDDDQRTFVVRKRNSYRASKAADDSPSDKENDASDSLIPTSTASEVEGLSTTDISLSESMTFDSCSLNEYPISDLPTTPEEASANITPSGDGDSGAAVSNGSATYESSETSVTMTSALSSVSSTLPSKLDKLEKLDWDEIDDLLQVERRINEKDKIYETMPAKLPSSAQSSTESSPTKTSLGENSIDSTSTTTTTTDGATITSSQLYTNCSASSNSSASSPSSPSSATNKINSSTTTSSDNFITASASMTLTRTDPADATNSSNSVDTKTTTLDDYETSDDATLKPMDFEDFKRSVHEDYVNGSNSFLTPNDDTLKRNQPIDPSRINDSLKFYGENPMSKSFNCEHALRSVEPEATLKVKTERAYTLQKSGSASTHMVRPIKSNNNRSPLHRGSQVEKGINRSKSGPSRFAVSDSDDDDEEESTLKPQQLSTIRRSDIPPRYITIDMNCYPPERQKKEERSAGKCRSECESSRSEGPSVTNSSAVAGDELTQTEEMFTASAGGTAGDEGEEQPLHVTEDGVVLRRPPRSGAAAIKRRSGNRRSRTKLKRRCSINGHFYNRETSFFTPPYGSQMSVWVTSLVTTQEVINLVLEKYKVDSSPDNFSLFIIRDNGEQKRLKDTDYPLITRVMLGPHEDVARLFLVDARKTDEISNEVAQFLNLSLPECRAILERYDQELEREVIKIKEKYAELRRRIISRMESLKVHL